MQKLTIKRSEWLRGEGPEESFLLRPSDGKRCCLGFLAQSLLGANKDQIRNIPAPDRAPFLSWPEGFIRLAAKGTSAMDTDKYMNDQCTALMFINDDYSMSEEFRENYLAKEFMRFGIEVEFVD